MMNRAQYIASLRAFAWARYLARPTNRTLADQYQLLREAATVHDPRFELWNQHAPVLAQMKGQA